MVKGSRRGRSAPALRRREGGDPSQRATGSAARWIVLGLLAASLVAAGYGLGRWSSRRGPGAQPAAAMGSAGDLGAPSARTERAAAHDPSSPETVPQLAPDDAAQASTAHARGVAPAADPKPRGPLDDATARRSATDYATASDAPSAVGPAPAPIAIVIDDLGASLEVIGELHGIGVPMSYAVLPFEPRTADVAARLAMLGSEILCHLPMQARRGEDPGPGALDGGMSARQIRDSTRRAIAAVPGARGLNNHMGSAFSEDPEAMDAVLDVVRSEGLFFLDSRTSADSVGYRLAREVGVPAVERKVFLDGVRSPEAIRHEFRRLLALADAGSAPAVAIGHPYPETIAVLAEEIPLALEQGYRFVRVSDLARRD